jgi:hypothetical protein
VGNAARSGHGSGGQRGFLQDGVSQGDVVRFVEKRGWQAVVAGTGAAVRTLRDPCAAGAFRAFGCERDSGPREVRPLRSGGEVFSSELPLVAFDVPADADFGAIKQVLADGTTNGWWDAALTAGGPRSSSSCCPARCELNARTLRSSRRPIFCLYDVDEIKFKSEVDPKASFVSSRFCPGKRDGSSKPYGLSGVGTARTCHR